MNSKTIAAPLGLIDPENLKTDERLLLEIFYEMFPEQKIRIYKKKNYLVIHTIYWNKLKKCWGMDQEEFPLMSLPWIVDRFENGFFTEPGEGGVTDFERSLRQDFDGELIGINSMAHCCVENLLGFNIWNANRASYISDIPPQQWDIPRYMLLEQGLLKQLKDLAIKYEAGQL